jgi:4-carboxymuconolactone decarboxylase
MPKNRLKRSRYEKGLELRRAVLGEEYVRDSMENATDFTRPYEDMANEFVWGTIWSRTELPRKTKSLVTVAILTALHLPDELKLHLAGALRNGCTEEEIREVLLQAAVYAGVPKARAAFRIARELFEQHSNRRRR